QSNNTGTVGIGRQSIRYGKSTGRKNSANYSTLWPVATEVKSYFKFVEDIDRRARWTSSKRLGCIGTLARRRAQNRERCYEPGFWPPGFSGRYTYSPAGTTLGINQW